MNPIPYEAMQQLFTEARSFSAWLPKDVSSQTLHDLYDLMKWGPTSANTCPARIVFVKAGPEKDTLISCLAPGNVAKAQAIMFVVER